MIAMYTMYETRAQQRAQRKQVKLDKNIGLFTKYITPGEAKRQHARNVLNNIEKLRGSASGSFGVRVKGTAGERKLLTRMGQLKFMATPKPKYDM